MGRSFSPNGDGMNFLAHQTVRNILYQVLAIEIVARIIGYLVLNLQDTLARRNIAAGFGFLDQAVSFAISEGLIDGTLFLAER